MSPRNKKICIFLSAFLVVAIIVAVIQSAMGIHNGNTSAVNGINQIASENETESADSNYKDGSLSGNVDQPQQPDTTAAPNRPESGGVRPDTTSGTPQTPAGQSAAQQYLAGIFEMPDTWAANMLKRLAGGQEASQISEADHMALMYDYDGAIAKLQTLPSYGTNNMLQAKVQQYNQTKSTLVRQDINSITHIFFHSLIVDPSKAFDGDDKQGGYNQYMTTVDEFNKMMQIMYDRGYVLVSVHDMYKEVTDANGNVSFQPGDIYLPEGKKAFVLSEDDVCFYAYMTGDGFASKIVVDENGDIKCEYINDDGSVSVGDYDIAPIIETFVKEHPDFSYKGAKGILAFTGYEGCLGYRCDPYEYGDSPELQSEREKASAVAKVLREKGWEFASHSWGHIHMGDSSLESIKADSEKWQKSIGEVIGGTDILIYPHGQDINSWTAYTNANEKFNYLYSIGFRVFCNVDSAFTWVQLGSNYLRQGRRNLDGYRMYYDMIDDSVDFLSDLFNVNEVFDPARPTPVPAI